jgi:hypothetical protein
MGRFQIHRRRAIVIQRAFPPRDAHAPFVAGLQSRKTPLWMRRDQVISIKYGEIQKFLRDLHAYRVLPHVLWPCSAIAVTIKTGHRIATTTFQFRSQDIRRHTASSANSSCCHVERSETSQFFPTDRSRNDQRFFASLRMTSADGL